MIDFESLELIHGTWHTRKRKKRRVLLSSWSLKLGCGTWQRLEYLLVDDRRVTGNMVILEVFMLSTNAF